MFRRLTEVDPQVLIRSLKESDLPAFLGLVDALADYEKRSRPDAAARERLTRDALTDPPRFWVLLAERGDRVIGYALYFETYSSFLARPTLYLEDIFVLEEERGCGAGRALMRQLAWEAVQRDCGRLEWQVLTWNTPSIGFYERLGAKRMNDWWSYRLTVEQCQALVEGGTKVQIP